MTTSVAMCTYSGGNFIRAQLDSIVNQTVPVDEIVICDDRSRDKTAAIIREYAETSPVPIRLIRNDHRLGYKLNFEKALRHCSGDVIFLSDQDDVWMPDKVETVCAYFEQHPGIDFVFTNAFLMNAQGVVSYKERLFDVVGFDKRNRRIFDDGFEYDVLATSGRVTGATTAVRASFLPYCLPFPPTDCVHDEIIAVLAAVHGRIGYIDQCLIRYRLHEAQTIGLSVLFKSPPMRLELTGAIQSWHIMLTEPWDKDTQERMGLAYKRFCTLRSPFSLFRLCGMYFSGEYRTYGTKGTRAFLRDLAGVGVRAAEQVRKFKTFKLDVDRV